MGCRPPRLCWHECSEHGQIEARYIVVVHICWLSSTNIRFCSNLSHGSGHANAACNVSFPAIQCWLFHLSAAACRPACHLAGFNKSCISTCCFNAISVHPAKALMPVAGEHQVTFTQVNHHAQSMMANMFLLLTNTKHIFSAQCLQVLLDTVGVWRLVQSLRAHCHALQQ